MKATRNPGEKTITLTDLPTKISPGPGPCTRCIGLPATLKIAVSYVEDEGGRDRLNKAISLDNIIIPAIVAALNRCTRKPRPTA